MKKQVATVGPYKGMTLKEIAVAIADKPLFAEKVKQLEEELAKLKPSELAKISPSALAKA